MILPNFIKSYYFAVHIMFKFFSFKNVEVKQTEVPGEKKVVEILVTVLRPIIIPS